MLLTAVPLGTACCMQWFWGGSEMGGLCGTRAVPCPGCQNYDRVAVIIWMQGGLHAPIAHCCAAHVHALRHAERLCCIVHVCCVWQLLFMCGRSLLLRWFQPRGGGASCCCLVLDCMPGPCKPASLAGTRHVCVAAGCGAACAAAWSSAIGTLIVRVAVHAAPVCQ